MHLLKYSKLNQDLFFQIVYKVRLCFQSLCGLTKIVDVSI